MNYDKIRVLFVIARNRIKKNGKAPIFCRLTYLRKRKQFSTGIFLEPKSWDNTKQSVLRRNSNYKSYNQQLSQIRQDLIKAHVSLQLNSNDFDVEDVYLLFRGDVSKSNKTILDAFDLHNTRMEKLIGKGYSQSTYKKFIEAKSHTQKFINNTYERSDYLLKNIKLKFLEDLDFYLKTEKQHKQITINKTIQRVRKIIKLAIAEGFLDRDPFLLYKPKKVQLKIVYLTPEELRTLENYSFKQKRLQQIKDLFIFCCYTGLAYQEMSSLTMQHIKSWNDGSLWIEMYRKKTQSKLSIPLLPKAILVLEKYDYELPKVSNQKMNSYLKEIAEIVGINKNITHHIARKTFATTVLLYNSVPMEIVSKLLGHSKMQITQEHYGKIINKRISLEMERLKIKLTNVEYES